MLNAAESIAIISGQPWLWLPPGLLIATTVLSINLVGTGCAMLSIHGRRSLAGLR